MRLVPPLRGALAACALMATASPALAQGNGTWALVNARIETVTRGTIERGTIVIRDGLIEAVGANIAPPPDARIVDLANRTVWPGIIDLTSSLGLPTVQAPTGGGPGGVGGGGGGANQQQANQPIGVEPGSRVAGP